VSVRLWCRIPAGTAAIYRDPGGIVWCEETGNVRDDKSVDGGSWKEVPPGCEISIPAGHRALL